MGQEQVRRRRRRVMISYHWDFALLLTITIISGDTLVKTSVHVFYNITPSPDYYYYYYYNYYY